MSHAVWLTKVKEIFMLYKKMVRFFSSLLTVLVCCGIFASAAYPRESPRIGSTSAVLSKDRYDDLCISCTIRANGVMEQSVYPAYELNDTTGQDGSVKIHSPMMISLIS